jgi:SAM-dependent methyltransferase
MAHQENPIRDKVHVRNQLYADPTKLGARIDLHNCFSTNPVRFPEWELSLIDLSAVRRALDAGCGTGNFLVPLARRLAGQGATVIGLDLSAGVLATARARVEAEGLPATCQIGDVEALPFADGTFDLALANFMLFHVPDLDRGIAELRRVLRPGGTLLAATNGVGHMRELFELGATASVAAGAPEGMLALAPTAERQESRLPFSLENGAAWLGRHFAQVRLEHHLDALHVTELDPLVAYFASTWTLDQAVEATAFAPEERASLRERIVEQFSALVVERLAAEGGVHITKDAGAFVAE